MPSTADIEAKFWKSLKSDRTLMLGLAGVDESKAQPMTAQLESDGRGPIWIFTSNETDLAQAMGERHDAVAQFASKGHDLFASVTGVLRRDSDPATIDRLWNPFVAAWFEGGKTDPKLLLLRLDAHELQVWLNDNSLFAGIKILMGRDPKDDYADKTAQVRLS
jgi:general stress protein 26